MRENEMQGKDEISLWMRHKNIWVMLCVDRYLAYISRKLLHSLKPSCTNFRM